VCTKTEGSGSAWSVATLATNRASRLFQQSFTWRKTSAFDFFRSGGREIICDVSAMRSTHFMGMRSAITTAVNTAPMAEPVAALQRSTSFLRAGAASRDSSFGMRAPRFAQVRILPTATSDAHAVHVRNEAELERGLRVVEPEVGYSLCAVTAPASNDDREGDSSKVNRY
jgi:hypothetical protein